MDTIKDMQMYRDHHRDEYERMVTHGGYPEEYLEHHRKSFRYWNNKLQQLEAKITDLIDTEY